jgi:hypothetical protein
VWFPSSRAIVRSRTPRLRRPVHRPTQGPDMTAVIVLGYTPNAAIGKLAGKSRNHLQFI